MESIIKFLVIYAVFLIQMVLGFPSWSLSSNTNTFGTNFDLICSLSAKGSTDNSQSKSDGSIDIHSLNGEPVNNIDKLEKQHTVHRMYTLTTSAYNKDGDKVQYECRHGNTRYEHVLSMTIVSFEYTANTNNVHQVISNAEDLFSITFRNFTQIPQCSVVYGQADHSTELKSTSQAPGQAYRIYLPATAIKSKCPKALQVTCNIGESRIVNTLQPANVDCLPYTLKHTQQGLQEQEKDQTVGVIGHAIFVIHVVSIVFVGGFILGIVIKECNLCIR
ncbi:uncharacterized protein LOC127717995 isoform X3 [Mytilus californianus]|uniref:uncharacterized protein LOC127717995 isoform X3 n=1 Tax=Mytilus californianus TaxID=6549 RepID=UPI0022485D88|nr:uncharacterized protein LOC127717995 isoform X3 [Mytilus californianus]